MASWVLLQSPIAKLGEAFATVTVNFHIHLHRMGKGKGKTVRVLYRSELSLSKHMAAAQCSVIEQHAYCRRYPSTCMASLPTRAETRRLTMEKKTLYYYSVMVMVVVGLAVAVGGEEVGRRIRSQEGLATDALPLHRDTYDH